MTTATYAVTVSWAFDTDFRKETFGNTAYDTITGDVKSISIRRGRSSDMGSMQQGTCTIRLTDVNGKYNPENSSSVLDGKLLPMRPLKVTATYSGTTYGLFYGYVTRIEHNPDPSVKESTIEAVDMTTWLNLLNPDVAALNGGNAYTDQSVGYLIGAMIDYYYTSAPGTWKDVTTGNLIPSFEPDGTASFLSVVGDLLTIDQGWLFVSGDGKMTYLDTETLYANTAAVATFTGAMTSGLRATITDDDIINTQDVVKTTGGNPTTQSDVPSAVRYVQRKGAAISSDYLASDEQAQALANFIVATKKDPRPPARSLVFMNGDATRLTQMLSRELGDLVTVSETVGGTSFTGWISSIAHEIWEGMQFHRTTFAVQKRPLIFEVGNGGFETAGAGGVDIFGIWTETAGNGAIERVTSAGNFHIGTAACVLTYGTPTNAYVASNTFAVVPGDTYLLQFWTKGDGSKAGQSGVYDVTHDNYGLALASTGVTATTWTLISRSFTVPAGCTQMSVILMAPTSAGSAVFDDVQVYAT